VALDQQALNKAVGIIRFVAHPTGAITQNMKSFINMLAGFFTLRGA
jgi:hypothetical protein